MNTLELSFPLDFIQSKSTSDSIVLKVNSNFEIRVTSKTGKGYILSFEKVRVNGSFYSEGKIAEVNSLQKVRELFIAFKRGTGSKSGKDYALSLAMRYEDPIVIVNRIIDPYGFVVKDGQKIVNAIKQSEYAQLQSEGYTILTRNSEANELEIKVKSK